MNRRLFEIELLLILISRVCPLATHPFGFLDRVCDRQSNAVAITDKTTVRVIGVYYRNNVETSPTARCLTTQHCAANVAIPPLYSHPAFQFLMSLPDDPPSSHRSTTPPINSPF